MKNWLPLAITVLLSSSLSAQITITDADMPDAGDSIRVSYALSTGSVDYTLTDTNYVWDFSTLVPSAQERVEYITPTAFPFNFLSDMGVTNYTPDSLPVIGVLPTNFSDYYRSSSSSFRQVGSSFDYPPIGSFSLPIIYGSPDYVYRFPLNYGDIDSCDAAYSLTLPGIGYIGQDRHRVNVVDGWGMLITPLDTYQVVRVRSVVNAVDTVSFDTTNQTGFTIPRPTEVQYKWLANGMKLPVLEVDCQILFNAEVVTAVIYQDTLRDSLFQVAVEEIVPLTPTATVYPNPAQDQILVQYSQPGNDNLTFSIFDLDGKLVLSESSNNRNSSGFQQFDVSGLAPGLYFFEVASSTGKSVSKIVIY
ncbi:MAG TPA: T9SS type A sorting domain-containing protein [Bacteroidia bacterium]|nr:T9SS type A sorting domain-containing protein [Bacteroidia bacterium]